MNMANKSIWRLAWGWLDRNLDVIIFTGILIGVAVVVFIFVSRVIAEPDKKADIYAECAKRGGTWNEGSQGYWCSYPAGE